MNNKESTRGPKSGYYVQSMSVKMQAVEEYENGLLPVSKVLQNYGITRTTLQNWRKQVRRNNGSPTVRPKRSEELKLRVVKSIITKSLTLQQASEQYSVSRRSIEKWCSKYSYQLVDLNQDTVPKKQENTSVDQEHIRQLEKALEDANLKIIGLETMINIAEQDLKIDIRKKSGTKQSKS